MQRRHQEQQRLQHRQHPDGQRQPSRRSLRLFTQVLISANWDLTSIWRKFSCKKWKELPKQLKRNTADAEWRARTAMFLKLSTRKEPKFFQNNSFAEQHSFERRHAKSKSGSAARCMYTILQCALRISCTRKPGLSIQCRSFRFSTERGSELRLLWRHRCQLRAKCDVVESTFWLLSASLSML